MKCNRLMSIVNWIVVMFMMLTTNVETGAKVVSMYPELELKYGKWINLPTAELVDQGRAFLYKQQCPDSALVCFSIVTSRYNESLSIEEKQQIYKAFTGKWYAQFFHYYDYPKAYESLSEALKISEATGKGRGMANLNLAMMYQMFGTDGRDNNALQTAKTYVKKAFEDAIAEKDTNVVHMAFSNMLSLVSEKDEISKLESVKNDYVEFAGNSGHPIASFNILLYDIDIAIAAKDYDKALSLLDRQSQYVSSAQPRYLISILMSRANVYRLKKDYIKSEQLLKEAEEMAQSMNMKDVLLNIFDERKLLYQDSGDTAKEADAYHSYLCMKDTLLNYRQISGFTEINFLSEMEKLDQSLAQMQYKRRVQGWIVGLCIMIIGCLICFVLVILRKNRKLSAANMSLYEKTKQLIGKEEKKIRYIHKENTSEVRNDPMSTNSDVEKEKNEAIMGIIDEVAGSSEELYSPGFTISKFAELANIPVKQLSKVINEETGENFNGFINRYRIKKACVMLDDLENFGSVTIENIGLNVGFRSRTAFISAFKKLTGLNPSDYLKAAKQAHTKKICS